MARSPRRKYQSRLLEFIATALDNLSANAKSDLRAIGRFLKEQIKAILSYATVISAVAAAYAAVQSYRQVELANSERLTPFRIAAFQTKSAQYTSFVEAASRLEESFRKVLFINPIFVEEGSGLRRQLTPDGLYLMNQKIGFIVDDFYQFERATKAIDVNWSIASQNAAIDARNSGALAMDCFFIIGPSGRENIAEAYFKFAKEELARKCPETRQKVMEFLRQVETTKRHLKLEIEKTGVPQF